MAQLMSELNPTASLPPPGASAAAPEPVEASDDGQALANAAVGVAIEQMNIVVVDPSRTMQTILRSMLQQMRPKRLRVHDTATAALRDMVVEPPNLLLCEWKMEHMSGYSLIKIMRHRSMAPLCAVPVIVVTGSATRSAVESALRIGAHAVLAKPLSPAALRQRMEWIARDERPLVLSRDHYVVEGVHSALDQQRAKDRLPTILQQIRIGNGQNLAAPADGQGAASPTDAAAKHGDTPSASDKATIKRRQQRSPTLDRLLRQRASMSAENEERARAAREVRREKIELAASAKKKSDSGRGLWKDLWGG